MTPTYATWKPITLPTIPMLTIVVSGILLVAGHTGGDSSASVLFALLIALL